MDVHSFLDEELSQLGMPVQNGELQAAQTVGVLGVDVSLVAVQEPSDCGQLSSHYRAQEKLVLDGHEWTAHAFALLLVIRHSLLLLLLYCFLFVV